MFSLLLKMFFCRFVKVESSSFCWRDVLVFSLEMVVHLDIGTLDSINVWVNIELSPLWSVQTYFLSI